MSNVESNSNSSFIAGLVIGGLVGVAIALVLAPNRAAGARASFANRAVTLNRSINQTDDTVTQGQFDADSKHDVRRGYEPPRIILDEATGASSPPSKE